MAEEKTKSNEPVGALPQHLRPNPDIRYLYANNVFFDTSVFDLKVLFGELRRDHNGWFVAQHTSVTLGWTEAKIAALFLALNVMMHEDANGTILLPEGARPPIVESDEASQQLREILEPVLRRFREQAKTAGEESTTDVQ